MEFVFSEFPNLIICDLILTRLPFIHATASVNQNEICFLTSFPARIGKSARFDREEAFEGFSQVKLAHFNEICKKNLLIKEPNI